MRIRRPPHSMVKARDAWRQVDAFWLASEDAPADLVSIRMSIPDGVRYEQAA
jgi:hypothetical protein